MQNAVCKFMYLFVHLIFSKVIFNTKPPYWLFSYRKDIKAMVLLFLGGKPLFL